MTTYLALLHETPTLTTAGQLVRCPWRQDGTPKPVIDYAGVRYVLLPDGGPRIYDYTLDARDG